MDVENQQDNVQDAGEDKYNQIHFQLFFGCKSKTKMRFRTNHDVKSSTLWCFFTAY